MIDNITDLKKTFPARLEAEQRLAEAESQCQAAAKKLEAAQAECRANPSPAAFKKRATAERDLEPFTDFLADRQKEAKAALAREHEEKRLSVSTVHKARLFELQHCVLGRICAIAELDKAKAGLLAELTEIANAFDQGTAEFERVAREIGSAVPQGPSFYAGAVVPRPFNAHDVVHALLPESDTVLGLPLAALAAGDGPHSPIVAKTIRDKVAERRAGLRRLKDTLPAVTVTSGLVRPVP